MDYFVQLALNTQTQLGITINAGTLPEEAEGIMIKPVVSNDLNYRFDKGRTQVIMVQLFVRSRSFISGWNQINDIHDLWHQSENIVEGITKIEATNNPNYVGLSEQGKHELTSIYTMEIERG